MSTGLYDTAIYLYTFVAVCWTAFEQGVPETLEERMEISGPDLEGQVVITKGFGIRPMRSQVLTLLLL